MDDLATRYCYRTLAAHGLAVGLTDGLMGNSEVGYVPCSLRHSPLSTWVPINMFAG